jgi:hypothetical protein
MRRLSRREYAVAGWQPDAFIQWQLVFFRSGARKNEVMDPIAE